MALLVGASSEPFSPEFYYDDVLLDTESGFSQLTVHPGSTFPWRYINGSPLEPVSASSSLHGASLRARVSYYLILVVSSRI